MLQGSYYLGIQLTEYLLVALKVVTYRRHLSFRGRGHRVPADTFRVYHLPVLRRRPGWTLMDFGFTGRTTVFTLDTSGILGCRWFCKKFSKKVGDLVSPLQKICSVYCSQKGKTPPILETIAGVAFGTYGAPLMSEILEASKQSGLNDCFTLTCWDLGRLSWYRLSC